MNVIKKEQLQNPSSSNNYENPESRLFQTQPIAEQSINLETVKYLNDQNKEGLQLKNNLNKTIISDTLNTLPAEKYQKQPVVILPLDKENYQKGLKKNVNNSLRWLVEWCQRLMKMFKFIYQDNNIISNNLKPNEALKKSFSKSLLKTTKWLIFLILILLILFFLKKKFNKTIFI